MLVSYKWLKQLWWTGCAIRRVGWKNVNNRDRSRRCGITSCWSLKNCRRRSSCLVKMCQRHTFMFAKLMWVKKKRQIVCGAPNVRAGIKVMVALPGARIADNYKIKKGKIRGLESLGMICSLWWIRNFWLGCPKKNSQMASKSCQKMLFQEKRVFSYLDLDDEIIELSITPNRADALFYAWGSARSSSHLWQGSQLQRIYAWLKQTKLQPMLFLSALTQTRLLTMQLVSWTNVNHRTKSTMVAKPPHERRYPSDQ